MCNDYGNRVPYSEYLAAFSQTRIPVKWPAAAPNLEPREDIWPTDPAPVIRRLQDGASEFAVLRWGFPSAGANSDAIRPGIPISFRPPFRFDAGHHSEMKPAT